MSFIKEVIGPVVIVFIILMLVLSFTVGQPMCYARTVEIGYPARWGVWSGCLIEVQEYWVPLDNYVELRGDLK